jgi:plasmid stability protein
MGACRRATCSSNEAGSRLPLSSIAWKLTVAVVRGMAQRVGVVARSALADGGDRKLGWRVRIEEDNCLVRRPGVMATLTLRDIPDDLVVGLEQLARAHGRSLDSQVIECLRREIKDYAEAMNWLKDVEALRAELPDKPIPIDELVAATERDSH